MSNAQPLNDQRTDDPPNGLRKLLEVLDLERIEDDIFRGQNLPLPWPRLYGGQVAAQSLVAASRTVPSDRPVHSLHSYFLRPGDPAVPVVFIVERMHEGRSFSTRRAVAYQHGQSIYALTASYQLPAPGLEHSTRMPDVAGPDDPAAHDVLEDAARLPTVARHILSSMVARYVPDPGAAIAEAAARSAGIPDDADPMDDVPVHTWLKAAGRLPDDPLLHACFVVFASDLGAIESAFLRHRVRERGQRLNVASLDHAMWFHRPFRADEWFLYARSSPSASGSRALGLGQMFTESGEHVATVMQEAMVRPPRDD